MKYRSTSDLVHCFLLIFLRCKCMPCMKPLSFVVNEFLLHQHIFYLKSEIVIFIYNNYFLFFSGCHIFFFSRCLLYRIQQNCNCFAVTNNDNPQTVFFLRRNKKRSKILTSKFGLATSLNVRIFHEHTNLSS